MTPMGRLLGLVLTLAGMGLALVGLAPERLKPIGALAYYAGVAFLGAAGLVLVVPLGLRATRLASEPAPPDAVLRTARRNGWIPTDDDRSLFAELLVFLARQGEIVLMGSKAWGPLGPIPAEHFQSHHILVASLSGRDGREWAMATRRPGQFLEDETCYARLRLPRAQVRATVRRIVELQHIMLSMDPTIDETAATATPPGAPV